MEQWLQGGGMDGVDEMLKVSTNLARLLQHIHQCGMCLDVLDSSTVSVDGDEVYFFVKALIVGIIFNIMF